MVRIDVSGQVEVMLGSGSHGHSLETTIPQVVADHLGLRHRRRDPAPRWRHPLRTGHRRQPQRRHRRGGGPDRRHHRAREGGDDRRSPARGGPGGPRSRSTPVCRCGERPPKRSSFAEVAAHRLSQPGRPAAGLRRPVWKPPPIPAPSPIHLVQRLPHLRVRNRSRYWHGHAWTTT